MSKLQSGKVYEILPRSVMAANAKSGFGLRWGNGTIGTASNNTATASRGAMAGEGETIQISLRKERGEKIAEPQQCKCLRSL